MRKIMIIVAYAAVLVMLVSCKKTNEDELFGEVSIKVGNATKPNFQSEFIRRGASIDQRPFLPTASTTRARVSMNEALLQSRVQKNARSLELSRTRDMGASGYR